MMSSSSPDTLAPSVDAGGLPLWHHLVFALALVTTVAAYVFSSHQSALRAQEHFTREVARVTDLLRERMSTYEDALRAGVAAIHLADRPIEITDWQRFERSLDLTTRYPGINGIGVILHVADADLAEFEAHQRLLRPDFAVYPKVEAAYHLPITFIEPSDINGAAVGLDMMFETSRRVALRAAGTFRTTQMTAPVVLVQDAAGSPGFGLFVPIFQTPDPVADPVPRFVGAVYAPFIMNRLIEGTLGPGNRSVLMAISDAGAPLYSEFDADVTRVAERDADPMFRETIDLPLYGRTWTIDIETTAAFRALNASSAPTMVLVFGLLVEASLIVLFLGLRRANVNVGRFAHGLTEALQIEKRELEVSNIALERYNYLSSHDLRTPLRGMHDVAADLRHDLADGRAGAAPDPAVQRHLDDLTLLIGEMDTLIGGMVMFSQIGRTKDDRSDVDTRAVVDPIADLWRRGGARIAVEGSFPPVHCSRELLHLIADRLIGNAVVHHPAPTRAQISVVCNAVGGTLVFQVTDDGAGIPASHQPQLFDRMRKIAGDGDRIPKAGLGLAMVKRAAVSIGGYVTLRSEPGKGSCFTVMLVDVVRAPKGDAAASGLASAGRRRRAPSTDAGEGAPDGRRTAA